METTDQLRARLEAQAGGGASAAPLTVRELAARFLAWGSSAWSPRPDCPNNQWRNCELSLRPLLLLYGAMPAQDLGPVQLRAVALQLTETGRLCCATIQARIRIIRRCWRWAAARGLVPASTVMGLAVMEPVRPPAAPSRPRVKPVSLELVDATLAWLEDHHGPRTEIPLSPLSTMIRLQLLTGMRPGEICAMRGEYVMGGSPPSVLGGNPRINSGICTYSPPSHKNAWRGRERVIQLGPRASALLGPWLRPGPLWLTSRGRAWSVQLYGQALRRACDAARLPRWSPNQLRHLAADLADQRAGVETAMEVLGHRDVRMTEAYLRRRGKRAAEYQAKFG